MMKKIKMMMKMMMMVMVMMVMMVSAAPLPPSLLRCDGNSTETLCLQNITEEINSTLSSRIRMNSTVMVTAFIPPMRFNTRGCFLSTCLTANLGSSLQRGDEMAGGAASDAFGPGRK
ncbi:uncharacterized protein zgc:193726 isoform X2 [Trematomus bernacchii]|uniref:uncharacterized protein zgc:193726 isoform X2 n=1 Tax=Trematomus bernacchii TaxID=40690 RepID=UPI00146E44F7|nr:uncharacterized protein zgc:193726 isoform X2 [Trematomus bernacchii]